MSYSNPSSHIPPSVPLTNLAAIQTRLDSLSRYLTNSVNSNTILPPHQLASISSELTSSIHQVVINGAALLSSPPIPTRPINPNPEDPKHFDVVELDAVELLAEHIHVCEVCGKGFKRDANLRMHMRAHGNKYKTNEALTKPAAADKSKTTSSSSKVRFSCPYVGCGRNKRHVSFRPLKSVICVRNHFKRSHCPKMYSCTRCHKKSFSVLADLKSHLRHCGENISKWKCSCGTCFSRKDKLFGHMALFQGHMPAVDLVTAVDEDLDVGSSSGVRMSGVDDGFGSVDGEGLQDLMLESDPLEEYFRF